MDTVSTLGMGGFEEGMVHATTHTPPSSITPASDGSKKASRSKKKSKGGKESRLGNEAINLSVSQGEGG